ncbi:MAG TPA: hypothetical protein H9824_08280 [Candidatus Bacteroides pullicola]|uniref:Lipoprotein n=1 Tax=Candidatus Bacteroides pullicola TaxID=2838475 RepID=A0A9D1ZJE4_9BACE|nr:hypothetical protein [Candidatus Bacteroides pullicola]
MKLKQLILGSAAIVAGVWALASCGGSNASKDSLFGEIPGAYEEKIVDLVQELSKLKKEGEGDLSTAMQALAGVMENFEKMKEEFQPMADKMVGRNLPYTEADGLPYRIVSDIRVEKVRLPEFALFGGGERPLRLNVTFDAVLTQASDETIVLYYYLMDDDTPVCAESTSGFSGSHAEGDTLHVEETIYAPEIPAKYINGCNQLKFVSKQTYEAEKDAIDEQEKQWEQELKDMVKK